MSEANKFKITDFEAGQRLCRADFQLERADVEKYQALVGDECDYGTHVPPTIPHGKALGVIVEQFKECAGAVHFTEEAQFSNLPQVGDRVTFDAQISSIRTRGSQTILNIDIDFVCAPQGQSFLNSKSVIIIGG